MVNRDGLPYQKKRRLETKIVGFASTGLMSCIFARASPHIFEWGGGEVVMKSYVHLSLSLVGQILDCSTFFCINTRHSGPPSFPRPDDPPSFSAPRRDSEKMRTLLDNSLKINE